MAAMPWLMAVSSTLPKLFLASVAEKPGTAISSPRWLRKVRADMMAPSGGGDRQGFHRSPHGPF